MDVITTHINADFDCLGAMAAAARLYPAALISFPGSQEKGLRDFALRHPDYLLQVDLPAGGVPIAGNPAGLENDLCTGAGHGPATLP